MGVSKPKDIVCQIRNENQFETIFRLNYSSTSGDEIRLAMHKLSKAYKQWSFTINVLREIRGSPFHPQNLGVHTF